jgi:hypothetical protein
MKNLFFVLAIMLVCFGDLFCQGQYIEDTSNLESAEKQEVKMCAWQDENIVTETVLMLDKDGFVEKMYQTVLFQGKEMDTYIAIPFRKVYWYGYAPEGTPLSMVTGLCYSHVPTIDDRTEQMSKFATVYGPKQDW